MQEAIRDYIEDENKKLVPFEKIKDEIDRVEKYELKRAKQKQLRQWRKLNK